MENENQLSSIGGAPQGMPPPPPKPPSNPTGQPPMQAPQPDPPQPTGEAPGFGDLFKMSFQMFGKHWMSFIKLTFIYLLPIVVIGGLIFFFVGGSNAAPKLPGETEAPTEGIPIETAVAPDTGTEDAETGSNMADLVKTIDENLNGDIETETAEETDNELMIDENAIPTLYDEGEEAIDSDSFEVDTDIDFQFSGTGTGAMMGGMAMLAGGMMILVLLLMVPIWLYGAAAILSHVKLAVLISQSADIEIGDVVKWGFKKLGSFIMLNIRIFIYTLAWVNVLISLIQPYIIKMLGFAGLSIIGLISLAVTIVVIIRTVRTYFAIYALAEKECTSKEALDESIKASMGNWWKIVGNALLFGIIFAVVPIFGFVLFSGNLEILAFLLHFLVMLAAFYIGMFFFYGLYNVCKMQNSKA